MIVIEMNNEYIVNSKVQQATVDNSPAGARWMKLVI